MAEHIGDILERHWLLHRDTTPPGSKISTNQARRLEMDYDHHLTQLIEALKADKSIPADYRNALVSSAKRLHMEIRGGRTMSNRTPLPGEPGVYDLPGGKVTVPAAATSITCICPDPQWAHHRDCPVHGGKL